MKNKLYVTGKEMCEVIAKSKILVKTNGVYPTANEIWNYSLTG